MVSGKAALTDKQLLHECSTELIDDGDLRYDKIEFIDKSNKSGHLILITKNGIKKIIGNESTEILEQDVEGKNGVRGLSFVFDLTGLSKTKFSPGFSEKLEVFRSVEDNRNSFRNWTKYDSKKPTSKTEDVLFSDIEKVYKQAALENVDSKLERLKYVTSFHNAYMLGMFTGIVTNDARRALLKKSLSSKEIDNIKKNSVSYKEGLSRYINKSIDNLKSCEEFSKRKNVNLSVQIERAKQYYTKISENINKFDTSISACTSSTNYKDLLDCVDNGKKQPAADTNQKPNKGVKKETPQGTAN